MRKVRFLVLVSFFIISILTLTRTGAAMNNPELIRWKAPDFNQFTVSAFRAVFGAEPSQSDWTYANRFRVNNRRYELFIALISSKRYKNLYGHLEKKYSVWWKTRHIETDTGKRACHCYYFADFSHGGYIPNMQYIGKTLPAGNLNYGVARALTLFCAAADKYTCTHRDCGFTGTGSSNNAENNNPTSIGTNLIKQPNFSGFNNPGPWIKWSSSRANQSFAKTVTLNKGKIKTALYIKNLSGRGTHTFGKTSQLIRVKKGQRYQISFYGFTKGSGSSYGGIVITIAPFAFSSLKWEKSPVRMNTKTKGWEKFEGIFIAPTSFIELRIISEDRGEAWITAMSLIPL